MRKSSPSSSSSSSSTSMKIKTLIQNFIFSHRRRVTRVFTKAKTAIIEIVEETRLKNIHILVSLIFKKNRNKNKLYVSSFRFHYHSNPSYFAPQSSIHDGLKGYVYFNPKCDDSFEEDIAQDLELTGYLHWLEEKNTDTLEITEINEIDDLAENYIANRREKFILEKQESDRKFQEMIARSL